MNPTHRLNVYFNYGGDYVYRDYVLNGTTQVGYGTSIGEYVRLLGRNTGFRFSGRGRG